MQYMNRIVTEDMTSDELRLYIVVKMRLTKKIDLEALVAVMVTCYSSNPESVEATLM